jgi:hypothetical protein
VPPSETTLELQRRLLACIERIEGPSRSGKRWECLRLIEDFESDIGSAIDTPIWPHLQSRLALFHDRIESLAATTSRAGEVPAARVDTNNDLLEGYRTKWRGATTPASEANSGSGPKIDAECDPLAEYRTSLGYPLLAPDLNGPIDSVPDTSQIWWRCSKNPQHEAWKSTKAQTDGGRPCITCMAEAGLPPDAWHPTDTRSDRYWLDAFNHALLSDMRNQ